MKETNWYHVEFWFTDYSRREGFNQKKDNAVVLTKILQVLLLKFTPFIERKFYLFEPNPHLFFAFELSEANDKKSIIREFNFIKKRCIDKVTFITKCELKWNTTDADNKDGFLDILNAVTNFNLAYQDNSLSHIIHCMVNNSGLSRKRESLLYRLMARIYR